MSYQIRNAVLTEGPVNEMISSIELFEYMAVRIDDPREAFLLRYDILKWLQISGSALQCSFLKPQLLRKVVVHLRGQLTVQSVLRI